MQRIRIRSDGTPQGTRITNVDTDEEIGPVNRASWVISAEDGFATATVVFDKVAIDVVGESPALK